MIIRIEKTDNYSVISNEVARRKDISARAKGLFFYLMTLPDDWEIFKGELYSHFTEGRDALNAGMKELIDAGYLVVAQHKDGQGKFIKNEYTLFENAPSTEKPFTEKPLTDNPPLLSTDVPSTDKTKKVTKAPKQEGYSASFETLWEIYPNKKSKRDAYSKYKTRLKKGVSPEVLLACVQNYCLEVAEKNTTYIMHGATFFGVNKRYEDYKKAPKQESEAFHDKYCKKCGTTLRKGACPDCEEE